MKGLSTNTVLLSMIDGKYTYEVFSDVGGNRVGMLYIDNIPVLSISNKFTNPISSAHAIPNLVLEQLQHLLWGNPYEGMF